MQESIKFRYAVRWIDDVYNESYLDFTAVV